MKQALIYLLVLMPLTAVAQTPSVKSAAIDYFYSNLPSGLRPTFCTWVASTFASWGDPDITCASYSEAYWAYKDGGGIYLPEINACRDFSLGFPCESVWLKSTVDYQITSTLKWSGVDGFDLFDSTSSNGSMATASNGVLLNSGATWTDKTVSIYNGGTLQIPNDGVVYIGYGEPYALITITQGIARVGGSVAWEYSKGSGTWGTLTITDGTAGLTHSGAITFTPPTDWAMNTVNGSRAKFWTRVTVTGTTTAPTITKIRGDDWLSHVGSNNMRGYSCASPTTVGNIHYCASPDPGSSATFDYQAWMSGSWAPNYVYFDVSNTNAALLESARFNATVTGKNYNSIFMDTIYSIPTPLSPTWDNGNHTTLPCSTNCTAQNYIDYWHTHLQNFKTAFFATHPSMTFGGNIYPCSGLFRDVVKYNTCEYVITTEYLGSFDQGTGWNKWDVYTPANNPTGAFGVMFLWDNQHFGDHVTAVGQSLDILWDNANRTPMATLAGFLIAGNDHTYFGYNSQGWTYANNDEFYTFSPSCNAHLTSNLPSGTGQVSFTVNDASCFTVAGGTYFTQYAIRVGGARNDILNCTKSGNTFTTSTPRVNTHATGELVEEATVQHWSDPAKPTPTLDNTWQYANYFPAMSFNFGTPNTGGLNGGARWTTFRTGTASSGQPVCNPIQRCAPTWLRDYTNVIVMLRPTNDSTLVSEFNTYGPEIDLTSLEASCAPSCTYKLLNADGTQGDAITQISLRGSEAAILVKQGVIPPPPQQSVNVTGNAVVSGNAQMASH